MSEPSGDLQSAMVAAIRADAGVAAAFGANPLRVYEYPPSNKPEPYIVIGEDDALPIQAECLDGAQTECTLHIWSQTEPPGKLEAKAIGAALVALLAPLSPDLPALTLASHRLTAAELVRARYLTDANKPLTTHGVVVVRFTTEPL